MKKQCVIGLVAGTLAAAAAAAGAYVTAKVVKEIKRDLKEVYFVSPNEDNIVSVTSGVSDMARGLIFVKVKAYTKSGSDECKFSFLSCTGGISCEWKDDEHLELLVGKGKKKPCCDIDFSGEDITLTYYFKKVTID